MTAPQQDQNDVRLALDIDHGLSSGTIRFIESLGRWVFDQGRPLSEKQRAALEQILKEHGR